MKVNNVELDEQDTSLIDGNVKWRTTESDNGIFSKQNIGFTIGLFVLTALVITGLVLLKNAYVPCSLARDANVDNVFQHLVCSHLDCSFFLSFFLYLFIIQSLCMSLSFLLLTV
jgi:hypothetical protein